MNFDQLKAALPDYAKDIRLNLNNILDESGATDLQQKQIYPIALASAFATRNQHLIAAVMNTTALAQEIS